MANAPKRTNTPANPPSGIAPAVAPSMTMVHGFAVQIMGFIPIPRDDLKKQVEISTLMLDVQEGRKTAADLTPHMRGVEYRAVHLGRRVSAEDAAAWRKDPKQLDIEEEAKRLAAEDEERKKAEEGDKDKVDA